MRATMDLIAAYNYNPTVLDLLELPEGVDRGVLIDNLLMETAEREIIYTNLGFLKQAIGSWSKKNLSVWEELYKTQHYEYNPIWNKDGTITETETRNLAGSNYHTDNVDRVDNLEDKNTRNFEDKETRDLDDEALNSVYGFNSSTEAPADKVHTDYNGTDTFNHTGTDTFDHTGRQDIDRTYDEKTTDTGTVKHERTEQGNIGLTSTQDLIKQQQELVKFNLMDYIIKDFSDKFCLGVY